MTLTKKERKEISDDVDTERQKLEEYINEYMDKMMNTSDISLKEAEKITMRDCKIYIKRFMQ